MNGKINSDDSNELAHYSRTREHPVSVDVVEFLCMQTCWYCSLNLPLK